MRISDWSSDVCSSDHVDAHKRPEAVLAEKVLASLCDRRMNERFQFVQRLTIAEHFFAKRLAIDAVGTGRSRKRMFDLIDQCTAARLQDRKSTRLNSSH